MNNGNNQEGIGIYFSNILETAETYGKNIVSAEIEHKKFIDSRKSISDYVNISKIVKLFEYLHNTDNEPFYYLATDWGIEISEPEDVDKQVLLQLAKNMSTEEVRNFQITLAEEFGVVDFVEGWNKIIKIPGTYQKQSDKEYWYAIIDTSIKVQKI